MNVVGKCLGLLVILFSFIIGGCAAAPQVRERFFWPPPGLDPPRIEWLGSYQGESHLKNENNSANSAWNSIVGEEMSESLDTPTYIASNGTGKVIVTDQRAGVMVFDFTKKEVRSLGDSKLFDQPTGVAVDAEDNIYVGDLRNRVIYVFDRNEKSTGVIDLTSHVESIAALAVDKVRKRIYVPDVKGHKIVALDLSGKLVWSVGKRGGGDDEFNYPTSVAVDREGNILVTDSMSARIVRLTAEGKPLSKFGKRGDAVGDFAVIKAVAVDSSGHIYVTDGRNHRVTIFSDKGDLLMGFGAEFTLKGSSNIAPGGFNTPQGIYIDQNDTIYVVDQNNKRFQVFQYVTEEYLKKNPITKEAPAAQLDKPASSEKLKK